MASKPWGHLGPAGDGGEVGLLEVGYAEVGLLEVGHAEVGPLELGAGEVGLLEVGEAEVGPLKVGADEVGLLEVGEAEVGLNAIVTRALGAERKCGRLLRLGAYECLVVVVVVDDPAHEALQFSAFFRRQVMEAPERRIVRFVLEDALFMGHGVFSTPPGNSHIRCGAVRFNAIRPIRPAVWRGCHSQMKLGQFQPGG